MKDMDMEIVAEGIETEQLLTRFADMKCEYIQGYYFSKPIPKNDFIVFITKHLNANK
ncbi:MAG: EAL domain-containing protein [Lachnospiraceae bacterium]|nr:EAL domain-containing protein [Lachnospiraceae bacterium]